MYMYICIFMRTSAGRVRTDAVGKSWSGSRHEFVCKYVHAGDGQFSDKWLKASATVTPFPVYANTTYVRRSCACIYICARVCFRTEFVYLPFPCDLRSRRVLYYTLSLSLSLSPSHSHINNVLRYIIICTCSVIALYIPR